MTDKPRTVTNVAPQQTGMVLADLLQFLEDCDEAGLDPFSTMPRVLSTMTGRILQIQATDEARNRATSPRNDLIRPSSPGPSPSYPPTPPEPVRGHTAPQNCPQCHGRGRVSVLDSEEDCGACHGNGWVEASPFEPGRTYRSGETVTVQSPATVIHPLEP